MEPKYVSLDEEIQIIEWPRYFELCVIHTPTGSAQGMQIDKRLIPELIGKLTKIQSPTPKQLTEGE